MRNEVKKKLGRREAEGSKLKANEIGGEFGMRKERAWCNGKGASCYRIKAQATLDALNRPSLFRNQLDSSFYGELSAFTIQHRVSSNKYPATSNRYKHPKTCDQKPGLNISVQVLSEKFYGYPHEMTLNQPPRLTRLEK